MMIYWKQCLLILLVILTCLLTACGDNTQKPNPDADNTPDISSETDQPDTEPTDTHPEEPLREPVAPLVQGNTVTLETGDVRLVVEGQKNNLVIKSFATLTGEELLPGDSDFALPETVWTEDNGSKEITWKYKNVDVTESVENGTPLYTVTFRFSGKSYGIMNGIGLEVSFLTRPLINGPIEVRSTFTNDSDVNVQIIPGTFASITLSNVGDVVQIAKESGMAEGYVRSDDKSYNFQGPGIYRRRLTDGDEPTVAWVTTFGGFNMSGYFPMIYMTGETGGAYVALEWSSGRVIATPVGDSISFTVDMDAISKLDLEIENNQYTGASVRGKAFQTPVDAGDAFQFPSIYLGAFNGSLDDGSNVFKHWFFDCKAPAALRDNPNEPLSQMDVMAGLNNYGVESLKWDYGWWQSETLSSWKSREGSWALSDTWYLPMNDLTTMAEYGAYLQEQGINWTVYVLLHDTLNTDGVATDQYGEFNSVTHPDWFSDSLNAIGMGRCADLGNVECVSYLKKALTQFFTDNKIGTWRTDFNPIVFSSNQRNRHTANGTDVMYWSTFGFREIVTHLYENVPNFRYESCSSGGSMKDLFTATLAVSINNDDSANYFSLRTTFYDSSYVIHPAQLQEPSNCDFFNPDVSTFYPVVTTTAPESFDFKGTMLDMGFRSMLLGSPMFGSWTGQTVLEDYYRQYSALYAEKVRPLVRDGELYHILPRPDGVNFDGVMFADPDTKNEIKGLVLLFKPSETPGNVVHLTFDGLFADTTYQLTFEDRPEQNCTATGADLMSIGLDVSIEYVGSELIWITEAK